MSAGARLLEPLLGLDADALAKLAPSLVVVRLAPGEVLVRRGEPALHLYVVAEGRLAVDGPEGADAAPLSIVGPGEPIGEVALVAGGTRSATVRALDPCALVRLDQRDLERLLARQPIVQVAFADTVRRRLRRSELAAHLRPIFGGSDVEALAELETQVEWQALESGATLFRRGDPADAAYIVTSGRLRALDEAAPQERALNEIGSGEIVGEMALLDAEPRSATVVAVRDSLLARIPASAFQRLIERHPAALRRITGFLIARLRANGAHEAKRPAVRARAGAGGSGRRPAGLRAPPGGGARGHGTTLVLDAPRDDAALGRAGASAAGERDPASLRLVQWLDEQERAHRFVLSVGDANARAWSERAVRQADHVLFVAAASDPPEPGELERALAARWQGAGAPRRSLVLVREPGAGEPTGTAAWLDARSAGRHYHVRRLADFARLARCAIGAGVGLVLGGGGARGCAHLGVLRALGEAGVPIDWVGGTSIGAILAGAVALGLSPDEAAAQCREQFAHVLDPTLPLVSLLAGRRIRERLESGFGERRIEDLPCPSCACRRTCRARRRPCTSAAAWRARSAPASRSPNPPAGAARHGPARRRRAGQHPARRRDGVAARDRARDRGRRLARARDARAARRV
jgi:CRP-like cAMP-binding protein